MLNSAGEASMFRGLNSGFIVTVYLIVKVGVIGSRGLTDRRKKYFIFKLIEFCFVF